MKLAATEGAQVPDGDSWIGRKFRALDSRVQEGFAAAGELTGAIIRRGLVRIVDFGGLVVEGPSIDPKTGNPTSSTFGQFRWGALPDSPRYNHPDGTRQMGLLMYRDDTTLAMAVAELRADDGTYHQAFLVFDRAGNIVISEDTNSGRGIARPHIPYPPPQPTDTSKWLVHSPSAADASWTSVARCEPDPDNPRMSWNVRTLVDAGVTAQYRWCWQLDAGAQGPVLLTSSGGDATHTLVGDDPSTGYRFGYWRELNAPFPDGVVTQRRTTLDLQVRITAGNADGTKVAKASVVALGGDQS